MGSRPVEEDPDDEFAEEEDPGVPLEDDDEWTQDLAEGVRTDLSDEDYERSVAPEPRIGWIIAVVIAAVLAFAVLMLR